MIYRITVVFSIFLQFKLFTDIFTRSNSVMFKKQANRRRENDERPQNREDLRQKCQNSVNRLLLKQRTKWMSMFLQYYFTSAPGFSDETSSGRRRSTRAKHRPIAIDSESDVNADDGMFDDDVNDVCSSMTSMTFVWVVILDRRILTTAAASRITQSLSVACGAVWCLRRLSLFSSYALWLWRQTSLASTSHNQENLTKVLARFCEKIKLPRQQP